MKTASAKSTTSSAGQKLRLAADVSAAADKLAKTAKDAMRMAKTKFKASRKTFKQAKKAAKKAQKELRIWLDKVASEKKQAKSPKTKKKSPVKMKSIVRKAVRKSPMKAVPTAQVRVPEIITAAIAPRAATMSAASPPV